MEVRLSENLMNNNGLTSISSAARQMHGYKSLENNDLRNMDGY